MNGTDYKGSTHALLRLCEVGRNNFVIVEEEPDANNSQDDINLLSCPDCFLQRNSLSLQGAFL
jgi:hypothetical protein